MEGGLEVVLDVDTDSIVVRRKGVGRVEILTVVRVDSGGSHVQMSPRVWKEGGKLREGVIGGGNMGGGEGVGVDIELGRKG